LSHTIRMWLPMALFCICGAVELVTAAIMILGFMRLLPEPVLWWAFVIFWTAKLLLLLTALTSLFEPSQTAGPIDCGRQPASRESRALSLPRKRSALAGSQRRLSAIADLAKSREQRRNIVRRC
jgi:hypothetical protein